MSRRAAVTCAIAAALGLAVVSAVATSFDVVSSPDGRASPFRGSEPPGGIALPEFSLRDHDGRPVHSGDLRGRVTILTFLDSQCTESCPVIAWTVARSIDSLRRSERNEVRAVAITADSTEDTRAAVRRFLARNKAVGRLLYLGGGEPEEKLRRVWQEFKVLSSLESGRDTLHSAPVRIYDRDGVWAATLHAGADLTEENLMHDLRIALGR